MTSYILCDSSSLISFTGSCLENIIYFLHEKLGVKFLIPPSVLGEAVVRPLSLKTKAYRFSALRIKDMVEDGVVNVVDVDVMDETESLMQTANSIFFARGKPVHLIDLGETEMLAAARSLGVKNILMDERTTRMLMEGPLPFKNHLSKELRVNIMTKNPNMKKFHDFTKGMEVIRSCDALVVAYENGFFKPFGKLEKDAAEAALYKIKFSGCSISFDEIEEYVGSF